VAEIALPGNVLTVRARRLEQCCAPFEGRRGGKMALAAVAVDGPRPVYRAQEKIEGVARIKQAGRWRSR